MFTLPRSRDHKSRRAACPNGQALNTQTRLGTQAPHQQLPRYYAPTGLFLSDEWTSSRKENWEEKAKSVSQIWNSNEPFGKTKEERQKARKTTW